MKAINCLLITTSNNRLGDSLNKTGVWLLDWTHTRKRASESDVESVIQ